MTAEIKELVGVRKEEFSRDRLRAAVEAVLEDEPYPDGFAVVAFKRNGVGEVSTFVHYACNDAASLFLLPSLAMECIRRKINDEREYR